MPWRPRYRSDAIHATDATAAGWSTPTVSVDRSRERENRGGLLASPAGPSPTAATLVSSASAYAPGWGPLDEMFPRGPFDVGGGPLVLTVSDTI